MKRLFGIFALCTGYFACSSVPEVRFVPDEWLADGGGIDDAGGDDAQGETGTPVGCPDNVPAGLACCGDRMCSGECPTKPNEVAACKNDCRNCTGVCCRKGGVTTACIAVNESCPL